MTQVPSVGGDSPFEQTIQFECSKCQRQLRVRIESAGTAARCPACGSVEQVPEAPKNESQQSDGSAPIPPTPPTAPSHASTPPQEAVPVQAVPSAPASPASNVVPKLSLKSEQAVEGASTPTRQLFDRIVEQISKIYVGQDELVLGSLVALFSSGHVLIESVPGLGKTLFVRTLGRVLGCKFGRIQFTADLMPSDITGAPIFDMKNQEFRFRPGPVFTQLLLADEINRSPAKTHAALLETMQEYRVTVDGTSHVLQRPFLVLATQNPIESEGTYNLPEAQLDRFMFKLIADYPSADEEADILRRHSEQVDLNKRLEEEVEQVTQPEEILAVTNANNAVRIEAKLIDYINKIVRATREWPQFHMGASPRAGIALMQGARTLAAFYGRDYAIPDDVVQIALPALRHRTILTAESDVEGLRADDILQDLIRSVEVPRI
ncbi:MAG: AAA family ATPase [Planctomycetales bacterium]|nr:AAA family ATPase [Planctomycetales bacterium]